MEQEVKQSVVKIETKWKHWHFHNTALLVFSLITFFFLADTPLVKSAINYIGNFGYLGAFLAGILFVSVFTIAPASVILFKLAESLNPMFVAIAAGAGGVVGDYLLLKYMKDQIFAELEPVFINHGGKSLVKLFKTPYFSWGLPVIGALIIMSPFPDEVGLGLLGANRMKAWKLMGLLFLLDVACVFFVVVAAKSF